MATKTDLRKELRAIEPGNSAIRDSRATWGDLNEEIKKAKRRMAASKSKNAVSSTLRYREEENEIFSWKIFVDGVSQCELHVTSELPEVGSIHPDFDGNPLRIDYVKKTLKITCEDIAIREEFDKRRVYETEAGSAITYKRIEGKFTVFWSYKHSDEIALGPGVVLKRLNRQAQPTAVKKNKKTQKIVAAYIISQTPDITGAKLTEELEKAFPEHRVTSRHGPHYLSLSRKGKLPEPPSTDPREW